MGRLQILQFLFIPQSILRGSPLIILSVDDLLSDRVETILRLLEALANLSNSLLLPLVLASVQVVAQLIDSAHHVGSDVTFRETIRHLVSNQDRIQISLLSNGMVLHVSLKLIAVPLDNLIVGSRRQIGFLSKRELGTIVAT